MEKIIDEIFDAVPLAEVFMSWGMNVSLSRVLATIIIALGIIGFTKGFKKWQAHIKNKKTAKDLAPYFDYKKVKKSRQLFIPTRGQNISPTHEEELDSSTKFIVDKKLIPWFINTAFDEKKDSDKYYLILAGSGMGKTTFMINLYITYSSKFRKKYNIILIPFGDDRILSHLTDLAKNRTKATNTILLLDAFDEYKGLLPPEVPDGLTNDERFRKKLDEIVALTRDFREVVITSRTQYFPGQENTPYHLKIPRFDEKGFHTMVKLYLSPFNKHEINKYLNRKYGLLKFWNYQKKKVARRIVSNSPKLMMRPMLLSYIEYLVDEKTAYKTTYEVYETLVHKWINREATKRKSETTKRTKFEEDLHNFSQQIAIIIYENMQKHNTLSTDEESAVKICLQYGYEINDYEITGQSLLTRDANHNWKFAHKSILEFFIAKQAAKEFSFLAKLVTNGFTGFDMTQLFCKEMGVYFELVTVKGDTWQRESHPVSLSDFMIGKYPVTQKIWKEIMGNKPGHFKGENLPVDSVCWYDAIEFCNKLSELIGKEPYYHIDKNKKDPNNKNEYDKIKWTVNINEEAKGFRLPTEAEWEFAARGGAQTNGYRYAGSNHLDEVGWYSKNSESKTHPVGELNPNELGIYDMSGNVWEWCFDWYGAYENGQLINPQGADFGSYRVLRGSSWINNARNCHVAYRSINHARYRSNFVGFRLCLSL
jgi:sulfatase modifying factor 1